VTVAAQGIRDLAKPGGYFDLRVESELATMRAITALSDRYRRREVHCRCAMRAGVAFFLIRDLAKQIPLWLDSFSGASGANCMS